MGKKAKHQSGGGRQSGWSWAIVVAAIGGLFAWFRLHQHVKASKPEQVGPDESDERVDIVRQALFSADGRPSYQGGNSDQSGRKRFSDQAYWEERYAKTDKDYDWYGTWNSESAIRIKSFVEHLLPTASRTVLNIGCGNSRMADELHADGYKDVMNVDISQAVVNKMKQKFAGRSGITFQQMDATSMSFADASFDLVLEKGTLDAMYTGSLAAVQATVPEVFRVLRPGGAFVSMSFGAPSSRKELNSTARRAQAPDDLEADNLQAAGDWSRFDIVSVRKDTGTRVSLEEIELSARHGEDREYFYIYVMRKP